MTRHQHAEGDRRELVSTEDQVVVGRNSQDLWIGVSRDLLITTLRSVGSFDELAVLEYRTGTDQRDEVGCVDGPPPGLC